jgi:hypothetical protein
MVNEGFVKPIWIISHKFKSCLYLGLHFIVIGDIVKCDIAFGYQRKFQGRIKVIDELFVSGSGYCILTFCMAAGSILKCVAISLLNTPASSASTCPPT